jgi:hypothetical protein
MRKIDIYNHIWPQSFYKRVAEVSSNFEGMNRRVKAIPMITDLNIRFKVMDKFDY